MSISAESLKGLMAQVRAAMQGRHSFETSQARIIGLESIKQSAGASWDQFAKRVRTCSQEFIERRLEQGDILIPVGDGFVVIYESNQHADHKSASLQRALNKFYLGAEGMRHIRAVVQAKAITAQKLLEVLPVQPPAMRDPKADSQPSAPAPSLVLLPVWSVPQETVTGYWISPVRQQGGASCYGYDRGWSGSGLHGAPDFLSVDLAILRRAVASVEYGLKTRRPSLTGYTVHASTLLHRDRRQAYLQQLYAIPEAFRPHLVGRIAEIEPGTPRATIADWVQHLRPVSLRVTIELHSSERLTGGLRELGIDGVACVAPPNAPGGANLERYTRLMQSWAPLLKREGLLFRVDNLNCPQLLACAVDSGVDRCTSDWLWPAVSEPQGIRPYSMAQFRAALRSKPVYAALSA